jgi:hypothetical protein
MKASQESVTLDGATRAFGRRAKNPPPAAEIAAATKISSGSAQNGIFASVLAALHGSRRIQARRVLHQYAHLISATESDDAPAPSAD